MTRHDGERVDFVPFIPTVPSFLRCFPMLIAFLNKGARRSGLGI